MNAISKKIPSLSFSILCCYGSVWSHETIVSVFIPGTADWHRETRCSNIFMCLWQGMNMQNSLHVVQITEVITRWQRLMDFCLSADHENLMLQLDFNHFTIAFLYSITCLMKKKRKLKKVLVLVNTHVRYLKTVWILVVCSTLWGVRDILIKIHISIIYFL